MAGKTWDRQKVGPRSPLPSDVADITNGCFNGCGETRPSMLMDFQLTLRGQHAGYWRLCGDCYRWGNPRDPRAGDPLHAPEKVA